MDKYILVMKKKIIGKLKAFVHIFRLNLRNSQSTQFPGTIVHTHLICGS